MRMLRTSAVAMAVALAMSAIPALAQQEPTSDQKTAQCRSFRNYKITSSGSGNTGQITVTAPNRGAGVRPNVAVTVYDENANPSTASVTWTTTTQGVFDCRAWVGVVTLPDNWRFFTGTLTVQRHSTTQYNEAWQRPAPPVSTGPPGTVHVAQPQTVETEGITPPTEEYSYSCVGKYARVIYQGRIYWTAEAPC